MKSIKPVFVNLEVFVITFARKFWWIFGTIFFVGMVGNGVDFFMRAGALPNNALVAVIAMVVMLGAIVILFWKVFWPEARWINQVLTAGDNWKHPIQAIRVSAHMQK